MTTILNGTSIVYNRSGVTIDTISAGNTISRVSQHTIVLVAVTSINRDIYFPSNCEIGDIIEVHCINNTDSSSFRINLYSGDTFAYDGSTSSQGLDGIYTKVSSNSWVKIVI